MLRLLILMIQLILIICFKRRQYINPLNIKKDPPFSEFKHKQGEMGKYKMDYDETDELNKIYKYHNIKEMLNYLENPNISESDKLKFIKYNDIIDDMDPELKGWITE